MNGFFYEIYVAPDSGPCTVHERGFNNEISWEDSATAIETAKKKKEFYPHMDFVVHQVKGHSTREVIFHTSEM